uniref:Endonuclease-reverse transcriptase n=1 Tax=Octopus bimaculoides TaxID=37653 RepID=A0A0L8HW01_OCTBM
MALKRWRVTCSNYKKIQTFINKCLRQILHLKWFNRVPNTNLWKRANQEPIPVQIRQRKWRWIGDTLQKEPSNVTRQALDWNPQGKRKRGHPKQTWKQSILDEFRTTGLTWEAAKKYANDRKKWKITVEALCSTRGKKD